MDEQGSDERTTWLPLALALAFVVFAVSIAFIAFFVNRIGDPAQARSVDDVAGLIIEAVDRNDTTFYTEILCGQVVGDPLLTVVANDEDALARTVSREDGATGAFRLAIASSDATEAETVEYDGTVEQRGDRSCLAAWEPVP